MNQLLVRFIMLKLWIEENKIEKPDFPDKMKFYEFQEIIKITDEIKKDVSKRVLFSLAKPNYLKLKFDSLNSEEIKKYLKNSILPDKNARFSPQKSFWGEIVSGEILHVFRNHLIPVYKLRYKEKKDYAMRGAADVLTYYFDEGSLIIAFTEVKTKASIQSVSVYKKEMQKAEKGLLENNKNKPEILEYICQRLYDEKKFDLLQIFDDAYNDSDSYEKEFHIFMVMEKSMWGEPIIDFFKEKSTELPNLTINIVLINSLNELIDETYDVILDIAEDVVNDFKE